MRHGGMALVLAVVWAAMLLGAVTGAEAAVSAPDSVLGPAAAAVGDEVSFCASGASCSSGHPVEYQIDWGDGTEPSAWLAEEEQAAHIYGGAGLYQVSATARCPEDAELSAPSGPLEIEVLELADEALSPPAKPQGYLKVLIGQDKVYSTTGAESNVGHLLEYRFDWGDGSQSGWDASGSASHAYASTGTYAIKAQARCQAHPDKESEWSPAYWQSVALEFSIHPPMRPEGASYGAAGLSYAYTAWGAVADCGATPEYQFDWGDGTASAWCDGQASQKTFGAGGTYYVKARARCPVHGIVSVYSSPLQVIMDDAEVITPPDAPTGPANPRAGVPLLFAAAGAVSSKGHPLEYQFAWGDGSPESDWYASADPTHVYETNGTYEVTARARCQLHPEVVSDWSPPLICEVRIQETVSPPEFPAGPDYALVGDEVVFSASGAASDLGHQLQYQFDWGDGARSSWGGPSASHTYQAPGSYAVRARARCAVHDYILSHWSGLHELVVGTAETVSAPYLPSGPSSGEGGEALEFTTGGAVSNLGHPVEYQFDWGDGTARSGWSASGTAQHAYGSPGTFHVRARARCSMDTKVVSAWSGPKAVLIAGGSYPVTWSVVGEGSIACQPEKELYEQGEEVTLTATAAAGWRFHHWEGDGAGCANPLEVVVNCPMDLVAIFAQGECLLRVECAGPGWVSVCPQKLAYSVGDWVQLVAFPEEGYAFSGWSGDLSGSQTPVLITISSDMTVVAGFVPMACTLEVVVYPEGGGTVSVSPEKETYEWGETVELTATAADGHTFNHWGGDVWSADNPASFIIEGHTLVKALFAPAVSEHFPVPEPRQTWMEVFGSISVCGLLAAQGDEIGVLDADGTLCGQFTIVDPEGEYGLVRVWGDDPATVEDEGAEPGDPLTFLLWDSQEQTEVPLEAVITGSPEPVVWMAHGELLQVELATFCEEEIPLGTGWNLISFRTNRCYHSTAEPPAVPLLEGTLPVAASVAEALASIEGHCQALRSFDASGAHSYDPTLPAVVNDLKYLAPGYGYWIKVSQPCTLILQGGRVLPRATATLRVGWNLIGCWANEVCHVGEPPEVAFAAPPPPGMVQVAGAADLLPGVVGTYDVLRGFDAHGAHTYDPALPAFLSDLTYVGPGYGYWLKMRTPTLLGY